MSVSRQVRRWQKRRPSGVTASDGQTLICKHQEHMIAAHLQEAHDLGRRIGLTSAKQKELGIAYIAPMDGTPQEREEWERAFLKILLVDVRCSVCGHVATGPLVPSEAERAAILSEQGEDYAGA